MKNFASIVFLFSAFIILFGLQSILIQCNTSGDKYVKTIEQKAESKIYNEALNDYIMGNFKSALNKFQSLSEELSPNSNKYLLVLKYIGQIYEATGDYEQAINYYTKVVDRKPDFLIVQWRLAKLYAYLGKHKEAMKHFEIASSKFPEFYQAKTDEAFFYYNTMGWYSKALKLYLEVLKVNPKDYEANFVVGDILYENGNKNAAVAYFSNYITYDTRPQNGFWHYKAVKALYEYFVTKGDNKRAKIYFDLMNKIDPHGIYARALGKGSCTVAEGNNVEVIEEAEEGGGGVTQQKNPYVAEAEKELKSGNIDKAKDIVEDYLKKKPDDPEALKLKAQIAEKEGKDQEAIKALKEAVKVNKKDIDAIYNLGVQYFDDLDYDRAIEQFNIVLRERPKHIDANYNLACIYAIKGNNDLALEYLEKALQYGFDDIDYIMNDPDLETLRDDVRFKPLIDKYRDRESE